MRILAICPVCKKRRLYINKRVYQTKSMGAITSQDEQCQRCHKGIKKHLQKIT